MTVPRFVSRISKPFFASFCPRLGPGSWTPDLWAAGLWAPCRTIITGNDQVKSAPFGRRSKKTPEQSKSKELDVFLGKWLQESEGTSEVPVYKTEVYQPFASFSRHNGAWHVETGIEGMGSRMTFNFQLGKEFLMVYPDNSLVKIRVYAEGKTLKWSFAPQEWMLSPGEQEEPIHQTTVVENNKLIWVTKYPDGLSTERSYVRG